MTGEAKDRTIAAALGPEIIDGPEAQGSTVKPRPRAASIIRV